MSQRVVADNCLAERLIGTIRRECVDHVDNCLDGIFLHRTRAFEAHFCPRRGLMRGGCALWMRCNVFCQRIRRPAALTPQLVTTMVLWRHDKRRFHCAPSPSRKPTARYKRSVRATVQRRIREMSRSRLSSSSSRPAPLTMALRMTAQEEWQHVEGVLSSDANGAGRPGSEVKRA